MVLCGRVYRGKPHDTGLSKLSSCPNYHRRGLMVQGGSGYKLDSMVQGGPSYREYTLINGGPGHRGGPMVQGGYGHIVQDGPGYR